MRKAAEREAFHVGGRSPYVKVCAKKTAAAVTNDVTFRPFPEPSFARGVTDRGAGRERDENKNKKNVQVFLYSAGPTLHHCMDYRFEPTESRLQCGEVPSLIWLLSFKRTLQAGGLRCVQQCYSVQQ